MRICLVDRGASTQPLKSTNPVTVSIHSLAQSLISLGHTVDVICRPVQDREKQVYSIHEAGGFRLLGSNSWGNAFYELFYGLSSALLLRKLHRQNHHEVIDFQASVSALFAILLSSKRDIARFVFSSGAAVPAYGDEFTPQEWSDPKLITKVSTTILSYVLKRVPKIIASGNTLKDVLIGHFHLDPSKVEAAPICGIESDVFHPNINCSELRLKHKISENDSVVLCVARVAPFKNQLSLVKAIPQIISEHPDTKFLFVGPILSDEYYSKIQRFVHSCSLDEHVIFTGFIENRSDVPRYYNLASVYVLLSTAEGLAQTTVEAMSCGKAIVVSSIPQNKELAKCGDELVFVDPFDVDGVSSSICNLLNNPSLRKELGEKARRTAVEYFDWKIIAKHHLELYEEVALKAREGKPV